MDDFYATLGVPPNAASGEIKSRYRFLSHAYHPDKFSSDAHKRDAEEVFKKINEAFQTLSNPSLRADYDRRRARGTANDAKSAPPPPRPASESSSPEQSPKAKRPGSVKYTVAAIFGSIIGGMLGASSGPLGVLVGIIVGLWFGIWACNREPKARATPPPKPNSTKQGSIWRRLLSPYAIAVIAITAGIGWAILYKPSAASKKGPWDQFKDAPPESAATPERDEFGGIAVYPRSQKPAWVPPEAQKEQAAGQSSSPPEPPWKEAERLRGAAQTRPAPKPPFDPSKPFEVVEEPTTKPTGLEDLGAIPAPPPGFKLDAPPATQRPASTQREVGGFVAPPADIEYDRLLRESRTATKERPFVNSLGMKFVPVLITSGPTDGQKVLFCVWETRVQDYLVFAKKTKREWRKPDFRQGPTHPAVNVSWEDAVAFCEWLSKKEGLVYRLPTDAEWSVAVGLGQETGSTPDEKDKDDKASGYPWGKMWPPPQGAGNYGSDLKVDDFANTAPVGTFGANAFGLYDLPGNVCEWCEDWDSNKRESRGHRGGSWNSHFFDEEFVLLSSCRDGGPPTSRGDDLGFRCVLVMSAR